MQFDQKMEFRMLPKAIARCIDWAVDRPIAVNALFGVGGLILLFLYAWLWTRDSELDLFGLMTVQVAGVKVIAVFAKELGLALLIAVLINVSIEGFNRRRHDREKAELIDSVNLAHKTQREEQIRAINEKMFQTVYERNIPPKIFRDVEERLLRSTFIREWSEYDLVLASHDDRFVKVRLLHRYAIRNVSEGKAAHTLQLGFDVIPAEAHNFQVKRISIGSAEFRGDEIAIKKDVKSSAEEWWTASVCRDINPNESVVCSIEYERLSSIVGKEVICHLIPTLAMTVRVTDKDERFAVRGTSLHPRDEVSICGGDGRSVLSAWEVDGSLFPGQGFLVSWMPRKSEPGIDVEARGEKTS